MNEDPSLHLYFNEDERKRIANANSNAAATNSKLNRKKKAKTNPEIIKNKEIVEEHDISKKKMLSKHIKAKTAINAKKTYEVGKRVTKTGAQEGLKMGLQQAVGMLLQELAVAMFDEVKDIYAAGFKGKKPDKNFLKIIQKRLQRVCNRVLRRWKDVAKAFGEGTISGFLSNLVTVIINMFVTTGKRLVRLIREGLFSLLRAIKILLFPPEGMTLKQAAHEASKLIAAGLIIAGGVMLEELIEQAIKGVPFLVPFSDILTTFVMGLVTGLATTFIVYSLDKLDLFGVNASERYEYVIAKLDADLDEFFSQAENSIKEIGITVPLISS